MKKINNIIKHVLAIFALVIVASCADNDVEPLFDQSVNERTDEVKQAYLDILTNSENGWIGYYSPNENFGIYSVVMNFDNDGSVQINSDYNQGVDDKDITFRIDKSLKIELVLESYAVFHEIFSINNNNNGGEFVFNILSASENEIILESKTDTGDDITVLTLTKASAEDIKLDELILVEANLMGEPDSSGLRNILLNDEEIGTFNFDQSSRIATIVYFDETGAEVSATVRVIITSEGFKFEETVTINGTVLNAFTPAGRESYVEVDDSTLTITDFIGCPFDINAFVGTYVANEEGYCDGCYEVEIEYIASINALYLTNLYDSGGAALINLNANATASNPSVDFIGSLYDIALYVDGTYGNVWAVNPGDISGATSDNISTFDACNQSMDLYFGRCVSAGCFSGTVHVELTKK